MTAGMAPAVGQLVIPLERPAGTPPLALRADADRRVLRADCDWTRLGPGWRSSNGWTVRPQTFGGEIEMRHGWAAFAPDGLPEWWAEDPVTAMARAEGGL